MSTKIKLECRRCGRVEKVDRMVGDPKNATRCVMPFCDECERGGEFGDDIQYFDSNGREISPLEDL